MGGKTNITLNTAIAMAKQGKRVMVLDADLGLANVAVMLGLRVEKNLSHVLSGECTLDEVLVTGPHGIKIAPATSGTQSMAELSPTQHAGLIRAFSELRSQIDVLMVVVCDEPTSLTDAYALIKILNREHGVFRFKVVANMVRDVREGQELFSKLSKVTGRFLDVALELVATVPFDENIRKAVRKQTAIVDAYPGSPAAVAITQLASKALTWPIPAQPGGHLEFFIEQLVAEKAVGSQR